MIDQLTLRIKDILRDMAQEGKKVSELHRATLIEKAAQRVFELPVGGKAVGKNPVKRSSPDKQGDIRARIKAKLESMQTGPKAKPKDKGMEK